MSDQLRLGSQTITVGGTEGADVVLEGPGLCPLEAEIVRQARGELWLIPAEESAWLHNGRALAPRIPVRLEYGSVFTTKGASLDLSHPALARMLMGRGALPFHLGELIVGRDPKQCHLSLAHPGVSARHAAFQFPPVPEAPVLVTDLNSTSGTWIGGARVPGDVAIAAHDPELVALGPVLLPISLLRVLHDQGLPGADAAAPTTLLPNQAGPRARTTSRHLTVVGTVRMDTVRRSKVGRTSSNDIVLDYPQISAHHATLVSMGEKLFIEDAGSELGTVVRGEPLRAGVSVEVGPGESIQFGPLLVKLDWAGEAVSLSVVDDEGWLGHPLLEIEADQVSVQVTDRFRPNATKTLLDRISFKALPGDLIALMGPSGSGKTTLLHTLSGYLTPSAGQVRVNGRPLAEVFDSLRGSIGYVPQDDIIHPELTVEEAVTYSACLRLPSDHTKQEIADRVARTLAELGLSDVAHLRIGKPEAKILSGGQRKRVNIAIELVTDPVLVLLDEPTSGLAADDAAQLVQLLARLAQTGGKTIIATIHQPARHEYERFNLTLVLGPGGLPLYFGPTKAAYEFFAAWQPKDKRPYIDNPRDMFGEMVARAKALEGTEHSRAREATSLSFRNEYEASTVAVDMSQGRRALGTDGGARITPRRRPRSNKELRLLLSRCFRIKVRDRVSTAILVLQAPLIAIMLGLVFGAERPSPRAWCWGALDQILAQSGRASAALSGPLPELAKIHDRSAPLFFLVVSAIWFGTSNAARDIVSERAIFRRENMVHLSTVNYVGSKFLVLSALCCLQCSSLLGITWLFLRLSGGLAAFLTELAILILTALSAVALGLLVSALVRTTEAAMALTPLALIPQVVLGGLMVPVTTVPWLRFPMALIPARWGFEGVIVPERLAQDTSPAWNLALAKGTPGSFPDFVESGLFRCGRAHLESNELLGALGFSSANAPATPALVLTLMTLGSLGLVLALLGRTGRPHEL